LKITAEAIRTRQGPMYLCPKCGKPSVKLYLPPGCARTDWACKRCHNLAYRSQYSKTLNPFRLISAT
jgi:hypothetical protein